MTRPHVAIEQLTLQTFERMVPDLAGLLVDAVSGGASVGFVEPFGQQQAEMWWRSLGDDVAAADLVVFAARHHDRVVGTVSLRPARMPNGRHRGEVAKLLVHRNFRRRGIGMALMQVVEARARTLAMTLLVLDTESGSDAERLYQDMGWTVAGVIPEYAALPSGDLRPTTFMYLKLD
jgi:GNAT superfamily N-acetyltransferase